MITLYHRSGVNECLIPKAADDDSQGAVWLEAVKVLMDAGLAAEAAFLSNAAEGLRLHEATNHYGDQFLALRAAVPIEEYERLRRALDGDRQGGGLPCRFDRIAEVISEQAQRRGAAYHIGRANNHSPLCRRNEERMQWMTSSWTAPCSQ